jgi:hypothetical protein
MSQHTPGEWRKVGNYTISAKPNGKDIDVGEVYFGGASRCQANEKEAEANAILIAAAPELLAHLQFAVKLLGSLPAIGGTAQVEAMRATIAKATGGAHD